MLKNVRKKFQVQKNKTQYKLCLSYKVSLKELNVLKDGFKANVAIDGLNRICLLQYNFPNNINAE